MEGDSAAGTTGQRWGDDGVVGRWDLYLIVEDAFTVDHA